MNNKSIIYTFYSYKGGVGRTMALANVAELFYLAGLKVLIVDWDLEAPGLERFFEVNHEEIQKKHGLIDMLILHKEIIDQQRSLKELSENNINKYLINLYLNKNKSAGKLLLLSAGKRAGSENSLSQYAEKVINFDWKDFYENYNGEEYFEKLRQQFKEVADVILIDSRTGVTEMGGVCTYQFADVVIMFCSASRQSLDGTKKMLDDFKRPEVKELRGRELEVLVVPARVEESDSVYLDQFQEDFLKVFSKYTPDKLQQINKTLWSLYIPYVPRYAYKEILAIGERDKAHAQKLVEAFGRLIASLSRLAPEDSLIRINLPETKIGSIQVSSDIFVTSDAVVIASKSNVRNYRSVDWGKAPDVYKFKFLGRDKDIKKLELWIIEDRCRVVAISGIGGIGKTDLSLKLANSLQGHFDYIIWRSLINTPPVNEILSEIIKHLSDLDIVTQDNDNIDQQLDHLLKYLQENRCLVILDNIESILQEGQAVGQYQKGYEEYEQLSRQFSDHQHQSCLLLTSREIPRDINRISGDDKLTRVLELNGFDEQEGKTFFEKMSIGTFCGEDDEWKKLIDFYAGNPLALELAAHFIQDVFQGSISNFIQAGQPVFDDFKDLLEWHFNRLSQDEQAIMYWLAINREPVSILELISDLTIYDKQGNEQYKNKQSTILGNLHSLIKRFPVQEMKRQSEQSFYTIRPIIIEYITNKFINNICDEIMTQHINLINSHAIIKATAKDYIRNTQIRLILQPIIQKLSKEYVGKNAFQHQTRQILDKLREFTRPVLGYAAGNLLNIISRMETDLSSYSFANLFICQAYLQDLIIHNVNLKQSELIKCIFTETFSSILSVAFSPKDGKYLATGDADGGVRIWEVERLKLSLSIDAHSSWVRSVAFSPDGNLLASGSDDQLVKLWRVDNGTLFRAFNGHSYRVRSVAFSPDGQILVSGSYDKTIKLWDINTGECLKTFNGHKDWVWTVVFSPNGRQIASSSRDGTVKIWDVIERQFQQQLYENTSQQVQSLCFSPDGQLLAGGSDDKTVKIWNLNTGDCMMNLASHQQEVRSVVFNAQGDLATASYDNTIRLWKINIHQKQANCEKIFRGHTHRLRTIAFSPDGKTLASGGWDQTLKLWDTSEDDKSLRTLQGRNDWICAVDINRDGSLIVSGSDDNKINLWDVKERKLIDSFVEHSNWVWAVAFSPDGKLLASGSFDKTVKIWDIDTRKCLYTLKAHREWVWAVAFSPDGDFLISGSDDQAVIKWEVKTGKKVQEFKNHESEWVRSVAFNPDGNRIASGSDDGKVRIWDVETGNFIFSPLEGHLDRVRTIAFSPDGKVLASGSYDCKIILWDTKTGQKIRTLEGHTAKVRTLAFNIKGDIIASGSNDETLILWESCTGKILRRIPAHDDEVRSLAFSGNGDILISSSKDGTIRLWDANTGDSLVNNCLRRPRLYEGMEIAGVTGLTELQLKSLKALGAKD